MQQPSPSTLFQSRSRARRYAMQALYQWQIGRQDIGDIEGQFKSDYDMSNVDVEYLHELLQAARRSEELEAVSAPLLDRPVRELDPVERAILLIGAYELRDRPDVPYRVVINEAVRLAKTFGALDSYKYVNGVLDKLAVQLRPREKA